MINMIKTHSGIDIEPRVGDVVRYNLPVPRGVNSEYIISGIDRVGRISTICGASLFQHNCILLHRPIQLGDKVEVMRDHGMWAYLGKFTVEDDENAHPDYERYRHYKNHWRPHPDYK